jgi:hypothetical protein
MNIARQLPILILSIVIFNSCRKNINDTSGTELTLQKTIALANMPGPHLNYVVILSSQLANYFDSINSYDILAYARFTDNGITINNGPLTINNRNITADADNNYQFNYTDNNAASEGKSLLGSKVNIVATKPGTNNRTNVVMSVPEIIFPSRQYYLNSFIDKAKDLTLTWYPDPINQFKKVNIEIRYYKGISQLNATGMPDAVEPLFYEVDDNGSFTIHQSDLHSLPKGSYIGISITRAWCNNSSGDNITYISITEGHTIPLLVTESQ